MKRIIASLILSLVSVGFAEVEYGNLIGTATTITLVEGETFTVMANNFNTATFGADIKVFYPPNYESYISLDFFIMTSSSTGLDPSHLEIGSAGIIAGPSKIQLSNASGFCSYKITRPDAVVCASPMNIVALPDDNDGDVDLLIETSTDLINWTAVYSGSAGTSNNAAFFRTRLISQ